MSEVANPWAAENWNLTAQGNYVKKYGVSVAQRKARQAGTTLGALAPKPMAAATIERHWIIQKKLGGGGGQGFSGSGAPQ